MKKIEIKKGLAEILTQRFPTCGTHTPGVHEGPVGGNCLVNTRKICPYLHCARVSPTYQDAPACAGDCGCRSQTLRIGQPAIWRPKLSGNSISGSEKEKLCPPTSACQWVVGPHPVPSGTLSGKEKSQVRSVSCSSPTTGRKVWKRIGKGGTDHANGEQFSCRFPSSFSQSFFIITDSCFSWE
ncbi:hypothetical protein AVEN_200865-1 [Araneus ventricosus]|uniref:Uncharacterized protein n=1 Tax=Araneus ventricosus TaxID=182803 RepID=A0A4Y2LXY2_ARAVE|nr:hypothetical protein AVEN_200865-1 [Araneus ventricosus]